MTYFRICVFQPMFWYHSLDPKTLALDEQFLFGSHVLVAPVLTFGERVKRVYLPNSVEGSKVQPEWCELDTGRWHTSSSDGDFINMGKSEEYPRCVSELTFCLAEAPLSRTPVLVRAGGILVLSQKCSNTVYDGDATRTAHIFPSPTSATDGASGSFTLIEDDGKTNAHVERGVYSQVELSFRVAGAQSVEVDVKVVKDSYALPYDTVWFALPIGDKRELCIAEGSGKGASVREVREGRSMLGIRLA